MGQGLGSGFAAGAITNTLTFGLPFTIWDRLGIQFASVGAGLAVDLIGDLTAKTGTHVIDRSVILQASDNVRHVYSFYCRNDAHPIGKFIRQKHEWVVLESTMHKFLTVQKYPATGNVAIESWDSLRKANDCGLRAAKRPLMSGEIQLHRPEHDFDTVDDLQVAYVIAWLRKEDPRWAFSTENSRHFCTRLRWALIDF